MGAQTFMNYGLQILMGMQTPMKYGLQMLMDGWMNGVLGHFYALSRLNWAGDNLG